MKLTVLNITPLTTPKGLEFENVELVTEITDGLGGHMTVNTKPGSYRIGDTYELSPVKSKADKAEK